MAVQKSGDVDWSSNVLPTFLQDLILVCHVHRPSPRGRGAGSHAIIRGPLLPVIGGGGQEKVTLLPKHHPMAEAGPSAVPLI
jgi:hypothetical protein